MVRNERRTSEAAVQSPALLQQDKYFEALTAIVAKLSQQIADHPDMTQNVNSITL